MTNVQKPECAENTENEGNENEGDNSQQIDDELPDVSISSLTDVEPPLTESTPKRKKQSPKVDVDTEILKYLHRKQNEEEVDAQDADTMSFLKSLLPFFRSMSPEFQMEAKFQIMSLLRSMNLRTSSITTQQLPPNTLSGIENTLSFTNL